jgi:hypothetical protein
MADMGGLCSAVLVNAASLGPNDEARVIREWLLTPGAPAALSCAELCASSPCDFSKIGILPLRHLSHL